MTENKKAARARYTLEFKREAVRLVESGQSMAAAAGTVGIAESATARPVIGDGQQPDNQC